MILSAVFRPPYLMMALSLLDTAITTLLTPPMFGHDVANYPIRLALFALHRRKEGRHILRERRLFMLFDLKSP